MMCKKSGINKRQTASAVCRRRGAIKRTGYWARYGHGMGAILGAILGRDVGRDIGRDIGRDKSRPYRRGAIYCALFRAFPVISD